MNGAANDATLPDAMQTLAEDLQPLIEGAMATGDLDSAAQLRRAKMDLENAASDIDAEQLAALFQDNPDFKKLRMLAMEISVKASDITSTEKNIARIIGIAAGAVMIASAASSGNVVGVIKAVQNVSKIVD